MRTCYVYKQCGNCSSSWRLLSSSSCSLAAAASLSRASIFSWRLPLPFSCLSLAAALSQLRGWNAGLVGQLV